MTARLDGKTVLVTGGGSGIGRSIVEACAAEGGRLVVVDISGDEEQTVGALNSEAIAVHADVSKRVDVENMVRTAMKSFGRLDVLCNCAGIDGEIAPIVECSEANFDRVLAVNLKGVFLGMQVAIPALVDSGGGSIINIASVAALKTMPGFPAYSASKAGVLQLTRSGAAEYGAKGIRVNSICPGAVDTPMLRRGPPDQIALVEAITPLGRLAQPSEVASLVVFLASDESLYVSGTVIPVDGAFSV